MRSATGGGKGMNTLSIVPSRNKVSIDGTAHVPGRRFVARHKLRMRTLIFMTGCLASGGLTPHTIHAKTLAVRSVILRASEEVHLAVAERGLLAAVQAHEGQRVQPGDLLVQVDDAEARLTESRARVEQAIASKEATNDVAVRFAKKSWDVAKAELQRAIDSVKEYPNSVSATELDQLRLVVEKTALEIEQAQHLRDLAKMTEQLKEAEAALAERGVQRRAVRAPMTGTVVEVRRHAGEWVEPGDVVARLVRMDRLRAEGFLEAGTWTGDLTGARATITIAGADADAQVLLGQVTFVSPEVEPVNNQVRVWVELDNEKLQLNPGMRAEMTIEADGGPDATTKPQPSP